MKKEIIEEWKEFPTNSDYEVSNRGNLRSVTRTVTDILPNGTVRTRTFQGVELEPRHNQRGDEFYSISSHGKQKHYYRHQLVWIYYNGRDIPQFFDVHHKNHDFTDNRIENLELISRHSHRTIHGLERARAVIVYDNSWNFIALFASIKEASRRMNVDSSNIHKCLKGRAHTAGGLRFKYAKTSNIIAA